jgi:hypothetical protein
MSPCPPLRQRDARGAKFENDEFEKGRVGVFIRSGVYGGLGAAIPTHLAGEEVKAARDGSPHHCGPRPYQQSVQPDPQPSAPAPQQATGQC